MKKVFFLTGVFLLVLSSNTFAFWIWTPETNKWVNPKYDVKETPELQFNFAKGFYDTKDYKKAVAEFEKLIRSYPKAKEAAEAQFYIGLSLEGQEKPYEAFKGYQKVIDKYPFSDRFPEVVEKQYHIGEFLLNGGGKSKKSALMTTLLGGEYDVIDIFRTVIKNAPYGKYSAPSQYKIGLYLSEKELYQEARDEFEKVVNDYPSSEWVKAAKYQIAMVDSKRSTKAAYDQEITKAAVEEFKDFAKTYPDAELSKQAQEHIGSLREKEAENNFLVAKFYEKQKDYDSAEIYYKAILSHYQDTSWAGQATEKLRVLAQKKQAKK